MAIEEVSNYVYSEPHMLWMFIVEALSRHMRPNVEDIFAADPLERLVHHYGRNISIRLKNWRTKMLGSPSYWEGFGTEIFYVN